MVTIDEEMEDTLKLIKFSINSIIVEILFLVFYFGMIFYLKLLDGYIIKWISVLVFIVMTFGIISSYGFFLKNLKTCIRIVKTTNERMEELIEIANEGN